ncbi:MAG TPA: DUF2970 domain-containing protein [Thiolinea sp.]|nr:DUF2970 domain-containing protein [Thiolinea sp.]
MKEEENRKVSPLSVMGSALAGLLGVQSRKNHERDFQSGKFWHFFIAGGIVTLAFILVLWLVVKLILATTPT